MELNAMQNIINTCKNLRRWDVKAGGVLPRKITFRKGKTLGNPSTCEFETDGGLQIYKKFMRLSGKYSIRTSANFHRSDRLSKSRRRWCAGTCIKILLRNTFIYWLNLQISAV